MSELKVTQAPNEEEVPVEILAQSIELIAAGMKKLNSTRLTRRALVLLIADYSHVNRSEIGKVLDALNDLERAYLKPKPTAANGKKK